LFCSSTQLGRFGGKLDELVVYRFQTFDEWIFCHLS
jgi:hypothetical protein